MARKTHVTVFVTVSDGFWAAAIYNSPPIESDWRWGEHSRYTSDHYVYHVFTKGGITGKEVAQDIAEAYENGRTTTVGLND